MANGQIVHTPPVPPPALANAEVSTAMVQQMAQAQIQSAYIWASAPQNRRDWDVIEQQVLKECSRPAFCAIDPDPKKYGSSNAMYGVPRGGSFQNQRWVPNIVTGFTIRFAEMLMPYLKSISVDLWPLGEDETQKIYRVVRTDYENNTHEAEIITVPKTVERKKVKEGDVVMGSRANSDNQTVYIVRATKEEMDVTKAALYSKAKRNLILSVLPGWLKKEAEEKIRQTQRDGDAKDPDATKKRLFDGFAKLNVPIDELKAYIGHQGEPDASELEELRLIYAAIAEGHTTWKAVKQAKEEAGDEDTDAKVNELFDKLQMTPAQQRPVRLKYVTQPVKLVEYLEGLVQKQGTPAPAQENPTGAVNESGVPTSTVTASQAPKQTVASSATPTSQTEQQPDGGTFGTGTGPAPGPEKPKAAAPAAKKKAANTNAW